MTQTSKTVSHGNAMELNLFIQCKADIHDLEYLTKKPEIGTFLGKETIKGRVAISPVFNDLVCLLGWAKETGFTRTAQGTYILI